jgi:hypothetical protein
MKPDRHPLLRDLLDDAATPDWAQATLARTLAAARTRRRRKTATRWTGMLVIILLAALAIRLEIPRTPETIQLPAQGRGARLALITDDNAALLPPAPAKPVHFLTDEELLARFPDRSVALIGTGPRQQLVFLDAPASPGPEPKR